MLHLHIQPATRVCTARGHQHFPNLYGIISCAPTGLYDTSPHSLYACYDHAHSQVQIFITAGGRTPAMTTTQESTFSCRLHCHSHCRWVVQVSASAHSCLSWLVLCGGHHMQNQQLLSGMKRQRTTGCRHSGGPATICAPMASSTSATALCPSACNGSSSWAVGTVATGCSH